MGRRRGSIAVFVGGGLVFLLFVVIGSILAIMLPRPEITTELAPVVDGLPEDVTRFYDVELGTVCYVVQRTIYAGTGVGISCLYLEKVK